MVVSQASFLCRNRLAGPIRSIKHSSRIVRAVVYALIGAILVGLTLGLLGSGGAILTTPILLFLLKHAEKQAIAESLVIVGVIACWGAIASARAGKLDLRAAIPFACGSIPAAFVGAWLGSKSPAALQLVVLGALMLAASVLMLKPPKLQTAQANTPPNAHAHRHPMFMLAVGLGVGMLTGFTGIGGGFLFVPALVIVARLPMLRATGTSLALIALNCASGIVPYLRSDIPIDTQTVLTFGALGIVGATIGRHMATKIDQRTLRKIFGAFVLLLAVYILSRKAPALLSRQPSPQKQTSGASAPPAIDS